MRNQQHYGFFNFLFDILMITGFKGKSLTIEKIVKIERDHLIKQAGSKYSC